MKKVYLLISLFVFAFISFSSAQNFVTTFSGNGTAGFVNGTIASAKFNHPFGICIDALGVIYVADGGNNCIRKINTSTGDVSTLAGTGVTGFKDGPADSAQFNSPADLCVDDSGNVYVSDFQNQRIRKISINGMVSTIAGTGVAGFSDGNSSTALFNYPRGICRDGSGNLYVGDSWNHRIRKIDMNGNVSTYAGGGSAIGVGSIGSLVDAADTNARFYTPSGIAIDAGGNIFVADAYNHRIRKIDPSRVVTTYIGSGATGNGNGGFMNGSFNSAILNTPTELIVDTTTGDLYISDTFNNRIRKADVAGGTVSTYAGSGAASFLNALDTLSTFNFPRGIAVSYLPEKKVFVADYNNHAVRLIDSTGASALNEPGKDDAALIFPNPASSGITIAFSSVGNRDVSIYDISGKLIVHQKLLFDNCKIDLSVLQDGMYFMNIENESGIFFKKKIIKLNE